MDKNNVIEKKKCTGCMACKDICPKNAITMIEDENGFKYPNIDEEKCIKCGLCEKVCPVINKLNENKYKIKVYACKNKDRQIRLKSSSGGVFSLLAKYIIMNRGVVFGARFNQNLEVIHDYIEKKEDIELFRGSKYVQSNIEGNYKKAKEMLDKKRKVLFTGTPCQIEGLLGYLGKNYENLYTQDIICHGVPSPKVWKKYINYKKDKKGEYPTNVNFRRKDILGWSNYQINYKYSDCEENIHHDEDPYIKIYLKNLDLRDSCYSCKFKKTSRKSDITIADFWGIDNVGSKLNDEMGISALLINSEKGEYIFNKIKDDLEYEEANIEDIIKYNSCFCESTYYNEKREEFFNKINNVNLSFEEIIKEFI